MSYTLYTNIKAKSISYGSSRKANSIKYIVIHYTANKSDKAVNNAKYYRDTNTKKVGAHYFVDETSIYQSIDDLKCAYAVGGSRYSNYKTTNGAKLYKTVTNSNSISIEMCSTNGNISDATIYNTAIFVRTLMKKYNITASNVVRHFDVTGKYCPSSDYDNEWRVSNTWIGTNPVQWNKLKSMITSNFIYDGTDFSLVFDPIFYADANSDLKNAFGYNSALLFNHFIQFGCREASRFGKTIATFNVEVYKAQNIDLQNAFGDNLYLYYKHYCTNGYAEKNRRYI